MICEHFLLFKLHLPTLNKDNLFLSNIVVSNLELLLYAIDLHA